MNHDQKEEKTAGSLIEVSAGTPVSGEGAPIRNKIYKVDQEAYNLAMAKEIKAAVRCPVMVVGGFRSYKVAEQAVQAGADYVSMARPFIREPDLARRWQSGDHAAATCISCSACFGPGIKEGGIYCVVDKKEQDKSSTE